MTAAVKREPGWMLPALIVVAVGVRLFAWSRKTVMMADGPDFLWQAQRFVDGAWADALAHPYHPLYGALTALASLVTGDWERAALSVSLLAGIAWIVAAWGLAGLAFPDVRWARAGAALVAVLCTRAIEYTSDIQSDGLFAGLALLAAWSLLSATERGGDRRRMALAGLLTGAAYLARAEALLLALPLGLWVARGSPPLSRRFAAALLFALGAAASLVPYVLAMHESTGRWGLSHKASLGTFGLRQGDAQPIAPPESPLGWPLITPRRTPPPPPADELPEAAAKSRPPVREGALLPNPFVLSNHMPPRVGATTPIVDVLLKFTEALRIETLILVVPGFAMLWRRRRDLALVLLATVLAWVGLMSVQWHVNRFMANRHFVLTVGLLLPVAGAGLVAMLSRGWLVRLLAVLCLAEAVEAATRTQREHQQARLEALAWVRDHTTPDQLFATHRRRDGWYAERRAISTGMPCRDSSMVKRLRRWDVPYFVFDLDKLEEHQPHWLEQGLVEEVARFGAGDETVLVLEPRFSLER